jgi:hypothetical protein
MRCDGQLTYAFHPPAARYRARDRAPICGVLIEGVDGGLIADQAASRAEPSITNPGNTDSGTPRICEPLKCDGLAFFPMNAPPQPLAGYIGVALDCPKGATVRVGRELDALTSLIASIKQRSAESAQVKRRRTRCEQCLPSYP